MLSTQYRLRLEGICKDIASGREVSLDDMIWANKLSKANNHRRGFGDPQDVVDWFHQERSDDWRQRD